MVRKNSDREVKSLVARIVHSPWTILASILAGAYAGVNYPDFAIQFSPVGEVFLAALKMCGTPIIICAIISSIAKLLSRGDVKEYVGKLLMVFAVGLFASSILVAVCGAIVNPGKGLPDEAVETLGKMLSTAEMAGESQQLQEETKTIADFFAGMIPSNVFEALSEGEILPVLVFSILLGVAVGLTPTQNSRQIVIGVTEAVFEALILLIGWIIYAMPIGLFSLIAYQIANMGLTPIYAMGKLVALFYFMCLIGFIVGTWIIAVKTKTGFFQSFLALRESLFIALGTRSSYAAIPSALRGLQSNLGVDKETSELVIPLSMSVNPIGNVFYYATGALFIAQLSGVEFGVSQWIILVFATVFASIAGSALPGAAAIGVYAIILEPLGVHVGAAMILLLAVDPILDPMCTTLNVYASEVATAFVAPTTNGEQETDPLSPPEPVPGANGEEAATASA